MALLDAITFLVLFSLAMKHIWRILRTGKPMSVGLVYIMVFIVYGLPIIYRYTMPQGHRVFAFARAMESLSVHLTYNLVLLTGVFFLWITSIRGPASNAKKLTWAFSDINLARVQFFSFIAWVAMLVPLFVLIFIVPNKSAYLIYGNAAIRGIFFSMAESRANFIMGYAIRLSFGAYFLIRTYTFQSKGRSWDALSILATLLMAINVYFEGKRSMLGLFVLGLCFLHILQGGKKKVFLIAIPTLLLFFGLYNLFGKEYIARDSNFSAFLRGDIARDYTLYYTIENTKLTENEIMPNRGNSFIWIATAYIPRRILTSKGWTTSLHFTASVFGRDTAEFARVYRWGYGIGFFEEFLLNFGYIGLLLFIPLGLLLRYLDKLIYNYSFIYSIIWLPLLYNVMFATDAALRTYVTQIIPILLISSLIFKKRTSKQMYEPEKTYIDYDDYISEDIHEYINY